MTSFGFRPSCANVSRNSNSFVTMAMAYVTAGATTEKAIVLVTEAAVASVAITWAE